MKHVLGRVFSFLILLYTPILYGSDLASYTLTSSEYSPYVKEAVKLTFVAKQKDHSHVMFFFLQAKESKDYKITLLNKTEKDIDYHNKETTFSYLLFPLRSGFLHVDFDYTIKVASDNAVAEVFKGGRDNVKWIETIDTKIPIKPLLLEVQELTKSPLLVGDFKLSSHLSSDTITAYESANINYTLQGIGYDDINLSFVKESSSVTLFSDIYRESHKATDAGYKMKWIFNYAALSENNFTIEKQSILCFSPTSKLYYRLNTQAYNIEVTPRDKALLLDKEEYPKGENSFAAISRYALYIVLFLSGFITAKILPSKIPFSHKSEQFKEIQKAKTAKELLRVLLKSENRTLFKEQIESLEAILYQSETEDLKQIKESALLALKGQ